LQFRQFLLLKIIKCYILLGIHSAHEEIQLQAAKVAAIKILINDRETSSIKIDVDLLIQDGNVVPKLIDFLGYPEKYALCKYDSPQYSTLGPLFLGTSKLCHKCLSDNLSISFLWMPSRYLIYLCCYGCLAFLKNHMLD